MLEKTLSFCTITNIQSNIAEVVPFKGVEIDVAMVKEMNEHLLSCMEYPFSLVINKLYSYSINFEAQRVISVIPELDATAIVTYTPQSEAASAQVIAISLDQERVSKLFRNKDDALVWLRERLAKRT